MKSLIEENKTFIYVQIYRRQLFSNHPTDRNLRSTSLSVYSWIKLHSMSFFDVEFTG